MDAPATDPSKWRRVGLPYYNFDDILRGKPYTVDDILRGSDHVDYKQVIHEMHEKNPLVKKSTSYSEGKAKLTVWVAVCMDSLLMDINELEERNTSLEKKLEEVTAAFEAQAEETRIKLIEEHEKRIDELRVEHAQELAALKKSFNLVPEAEEHEKELPVDHAA